jgi:hypothetical protein
MPEIPTAPLHIPDVGIDIVDTASLDMLEVPSPTSSIITNPYEYPHTTEYTATGFIDHFQIHGRHFSQALNITSAEFPYREFPGFVHPALNPSSTVSEGNAPGASSSGNEGS